MDLDSKKQKSPNVSGKFILISLFGVAVVVWLMAVLYSIIPKNADMVISIALPIMALLLLYVLPKKKRAILATQVGRTKIGKLLKIYETILLIIMAAYIIHFVLEWALN